MSEGARTWGLRLLALAIAIAVWYSVSLSGRESLTETTVDQVNVSYNMPRGLVVLNPGRTVRVRLRGSSKKIRQLNPSLVRAQVELTQSEPGEVDVTLGPDDIQVSDDFEVVSIDPNTIRVEVDREVTQRVLVRARLAGEPAAGARLGEPEVFPDQVMVTGPESLIIKLEALQTRPVRLDGHALTFEETVSVVPPEDPLIQIVQPSKVAVRVPLQPPALPEEEGQERVKGKVKG